MADTSLLDLHPDLRPLTQQWLLECATQGLDVKITETWRDPSRENKLHAEGITKATGLTCEHCGMIDNKPASRAFDFAAFINHVYITNGKDSVYALAGQIAESLGLVWGGRFHNPDWDHVELPPALVLAPTEEFS